jgi:hypothetical protein
MSPSDMCDNIWRSVRRRLRNNLAIICHDQHQDKYFRERGGTVVLNTRTLSGAPNSTNSARLSACSLVLAAWLGLHKQCCEMCPSTMTIHRAIVDLLLCKNV